MPRLPRRVSVSIGLKGVGERLMLCQDVEVSSLHEVAKVADGQVPYFLE